jgi:hypothetical protein
MDSRGCQEIEEAVYGLGELYGELRMQYPKTARSKLDLILLDQAKKVGETAEHDIRNNFPGLFED